MNLLELKYYFENFAIDEIYKVSHNYFFRMVDAKTLATTTNDVVEIITRNAFEFAYENEKEIQRKLREEQFKNFQNIYHNLETIQQTDKVVKNNKNKNKK